MFYIENSVLFQKGSTDFWNVFFGNNFSENLAILQFRSFINIPQKSPKHLYFNIVNVNFSHEKISMTDYNKKNIVSVNFGWATLTPTTSYPQHHL